MQWGWLAKYSFFDESLNIRWILESDMFLLFNFVVKYE